MVDNIKGYVSGLGLVVPETTMDRLFGKKKEDFLKGLCVTAVNKFGKPKPIQLYRKIIVNKSPHVVLPRGCAERLRKHGGMLLDDMLPELPRIRYAFEGELYENQKIVCDYLMERYFNGKFGSCTLNMGAGLGKTATAAGLIQRIGSRSLFVVKDRFLQKQAFVEMKSFFPTASICKFENKKYKPDTPYDIVIIVINSALLQRREFFNSFGLVIFDEVHTYCKRKRAEVFWLAQTRYLLGMSATTDDRPDRLDPVFHRHLGDVVHAASLPGFDISGAEFQGDVKVIKYHGDEKYCRDVISEATGALFTPAMIDLIIQDPARNTAIVDEIVELWRDPIRHIYVFSEYRSHLETLAEMIRKRIGVEPAFDDAIPQCNTMMGGIKDDALAIAIKSRIILTTYGYGSTGVSIPVMNASVFATPRRNGYKQTCPRIMRRGSDVTIVRKFIDFVDVNCGLKYQYGGRFQAYDFYGFAIKKTVLKPKTA